MKELLLQYLYNKIGNEKLMTEYLKHHNKPTHNLYNVYTFTEQRGNMVMKATVRLIDYLIEKFMERIVDKLMYTHNIITLFNKEGKIIKYY